MKSIRSRRHIRSAVNALEFLEPRQLLSATLNNTIPTQALTAGQGPVSLTLGSFFSDPALASGDTIVNLQTPNGDIPIELTSVATPQTVANFLHYLSSGEYNNTIIHRSVPHFVIQGGGYTENGSHISTFGTVPGESSTATFKNTTGTIAMALSSGPDSGTSEWFINLANNPFLDDTSDGGPFTAFGTTIYGGLAVADSIAALPIVNDTTSGAWNTMPVENGTNGSTVSSVPSSDFVTINPVVVPGGLNFSVSSNNNSVVTASVSNGSLTLTPVGAGSTTVQVTATDLGGGTATYTFAVSTIGPGSIVNNGGVVTVTGSNESDTIAAGVNPLDSSQYYFLIQSPGQQEIKQLYSTSAVTGLQINCDPAGIGTSGANADLVNLGGSNFNMPVTINGGSGSDTIIGQRSPNFITTGAGSTHNIVYGSVGADSIVSQGFNDTMRSGGGRDTIRANTGNNVLVGGKDGSRLWAGNGHDTLRGGAGNSTLHGGSGGSLLIGGFGNDLLDAGSGFDTIIAGTGHSTLLGGASDDFLDAGWDAYLVLQGGSTMPTATLSDSVDGSASLSDTLVASSGSPTIVGGSGNSIFAVNDPAATLQNVGSSFVARNDTVASPTQLIKVHLTIQDSNGGVIRNVVIPNGAGAAPSGTSAAMTTSPNGRIQFESNGPRTFTLADFFNHWGVNFSVLGIGQFIASSGSGHTLGMTVNGVANTQFQNYAVQDGDNIVITFTQ